MKRVLSLAAVALALVACSSMATKREDARLALYRAHAGAPVSGFHYFGRFDGWEALGDDVLAVWTRPRQAYLVELYGPCNGLDYTPVIGVTSQFGSEVQAGFDKILVRDPATHDFPCPIRTIRPLDVDAIREADRAAREAPSSDH